MPQAEQEAGCGRGDGVGGLAGGAGGEGQGREQDGGAAFMVAFVISAVGD